MTNKNSFHLSDQTYFRLIILLATLGVVIFLIFAATQDITKIVFLILIALAIILPIGTKLIRETFDIFEPLFIANVALGVMFLARPVADLLTGETIHLGYDILPTFNEALMLVFVGIAAFEVGYFLGPGSLWSQYLPQPEKFRVDQVRIAGFFFLFLGGFLFSLFLAKGGGLDLLLFLMKGRQAEDNGIFLASSGYYYNGLLMWSASALIFFALFILLKQRFFLFIFVIVFGALAIFYGSRGTRSQLLPLTIALPTFWYLFHQKRPSGFVLSITFLILISLAGWLREVRNVGVVSYDQKDTPTLTSALASPFKQLGDIITGYDNEMFDALCNELLVVPESLPYKPLGSIADIFIRIIPRSMWPNGEKPLETNDSVIVALWPEHYEHSRASSALSILGPFYADSGFIGVAIGMFFIGVILSMMWHWFLANQRNYTALLLYSMSLPFVIILMRGTLPDTLSRILFMVVPIFILLMIERFRLVKSH